MHGARSAFACLPDRLAGRGQGGCRTLNSEVLEGSGYGNAPRSGGAHLWLVRWCLLHGEADLKLWKTRPALQPSSTEQGYLSKLKIQRPNGPTAQRRPEALKGRLNAQAKQGAMESCALMMERM